MPFRSAHHIVGALVAEVEEADVGLEDAPDALVQLVLAGSADPRAVELASQAGIAEELRAAASLEAAIASCDVVGGTAPARVGAALAAARERIDREMGGR